MSRSAQKRSTSSSSRSMKLYAFWTSPRSTVSSAAATSSTVALLSPIDSILPSSLRAASSPSCSLIGMPARAGGHQAQVHEGERVEPQCPQVGLDPGPQLVGTLGGQDPAAVVAARADLRDEPQVRRVRVQHVADELVDGVGAVVLRGVDV